MALACLGAVRGTGTVASIGEERVWVRLSVARDTEDIALTGASHDVFGIARRAAGNAESSLLRMRHPDRVSLRLELSLLSYLSSSIGAFTWGGSGTQTWAERWDIGIQRPRP